MSLVDFKRNSGEATRVVEESGLDIARYKKLGQMLKTNAARYFAKADGIENAIEVFSADIEAYAMLADQLHYLRMGKKHASRVGYAAYITTNEPRTLKYLNGKVRKALQSTKVAKLNTPTHFGPLTDYAIECPFP